jgi:hypothetical protein
LSDPHGIEVAAMVQTIDVEVLEDTVQDPAPISTDVGLFSLAPVSVRVRVPVVEHAWTWGAPQSTLSTRGPAEQKTPSVAGVHVSDLVESHGRTEGEAEQAIILEFVPWICVIFPLYTSGFSNSATMSMVAELMMVTDVESVDKKSYEFT